MMDIKLTLDAEDAAAIGIDRNALIKNIQAEVDKLADHANIERAVPQPESPPPGAQGDPVIWHWLLHFAEQPDMIKLYARGLISGVTSIIDAARGGSAAPSTEVQPSVKARIVILGREIALPATSAAIRTFVDGFNTDHHGS